MRKLMPKERKLFLPYLDYEEMWTRLKDFAHLKYWAVKKTLNRIEDEMITLLFRPIPDYGDHMTWSEFEEHVKNGMFMDYDGIGYYATKDEECRISVDLWDIKYNYSAFKGIFTHITWYNK